MLPVEFCGISSLMLIVKRAARINKIQEVFKYSAANIKSVST